MKLSKKIQRGIIKSWFRYGGAITPRLVAKVAYNKFFNRPLRFKPVSYDNTLLNQAEVLNLKFENETTQGYSWGDGSRTVLLAHGWSSHALTMRKFIPRLLDKGFRVIAFDGPAHGNSTGITTNGVEYRRFVSQLIATYKPYAVVGHSLGGICLLAALAHASDNFKVEKVVTIAAPIYRKTMVLQFLEKANLHKLSHPHFYRYVENNLGSDPTKFELHHLYPTGIKHNGLIVHDTDDSIIPYAEAVKLSQMWPTAKLITTSRLDHSGVLKDSLVVEEVVSFLYN